jgi:hypothetical protein
MKVSELAHKVLGFDGNLPVYMIVGGERRRFGIIRVPEGLYLVPNLDEKVPLPADLVENRSVTSKIT